MRLKAVTLPCSRHPTEGWQLEVHTGDTKLVGDRHFEHPLSCCRSRIGVNVENHPGVGTSKLNSRLMNNVAPDEELLTD
jgi:hypothetical protein